MKPVLLFGGGGHCRSVIDVIEASSEWQVLGIVERLGGGQVSVLGYPVVGYDNELDRLLAMCCYAMVTVGQIKSAKTRRDLYQRLHSVGFQLPVIISPLAHVARTAQIADGVVIHHYAHVGPNCIIGPNTIINTRAVIEHDAKIGAHCHVSTAAVLNGGSILGAESFLGSGSICREGIVIGDSSIVGMGSLIRKSTPDPHSYMERK